MIWRSPILGKKSLIYGPDTIMKNKEGLRKVTKNITICWLAKKNRYKAWSLYKLEQSWTQNAKHKKFMFLEMVCGDVNAYISIGIWRKDSLPWTDSIFIKILELLYSRPRSSAKCWRQILNVGLSVRTWKGWLAYRRTHRRPAYSDNKAPRRWLKLSHPTNYFH